ncbi:zinc finger protein 62 homolog isoform X2 [Wyeomyia smithii]|nr:zinc finger protein 62 homolog isoform X2 [Wyeomyia smithii]
MLSLKGSLHKDRIDTLASELLNVCIRENDLFQLVCQNCVARIEIVKSIQTAFSDAEFTFQRLVEISAGQICCIKDDCDMDLNFTEAETDFYDEEVMNTENSMQNVAQRIGKIKIDKVEPPPPKSPAFSGKNTLREALKKCYICIQEFENPSQLLEHLTEKHLSAGGFYCHECSRDLPTIMQYNRHLSRHDETERPIKCRFCPMRYVTHASAKSHERQEHGKNSKKRKHSKDRNVVCEQCGKFFYPSTIGNHIRLKHEKKHPKCHLCERTFTNGATLARHMLVHTNTKPYSCDQCDNTYRRQLDLRHHKSLVHDGINPHVCSQCNQEFKSYSHLYDHRQRVHLKKMPKKPIEMPKKPIDYEGFRTCRLCDTKFKKDKELVEHISQKHSTEEYPMWLCTECPRSFYTSTQLSIHKNIHTDKFECTECGARHTQKTTLQFHMETKHSDGSVFKCSDCEQTFASRFYLYRHSILHKKGKRFQCDFCPKSFLETIQLKNHRRTHTGEKPFECPVCLARFGDGSTFSKHKKRCMAALSNKNNDAEEGAIKPAATRKVPTCHRSDTAVRPFPEDQALASRWLDAIEVGCGYTMLLTENDIQPEICSLHFSDPDKYGYEEPSIFVHCNETSTEISSCRLCLAFYPSKDMVPLEGTLGENNIASLLESMEMSIRDDHFLRLICLPCLTQLDILTALHSKFSQSEQLFQGLLAKSQNKMQDDDFKENASSPQEKLMDRQNNKPKVRQKPLNDDVRRSERHIKKSSSADAPTNNNNKAKKKQASSLNNKLERYCYICETFQSDSNQLTLHLIEMHTSETGYHCEECHLDIPLLTSYNRHLSRHDELERPLKCSVCSVRFVSHLQVKVHENKMHGAKHDVKQQKSKVREVICDKCGEICDTRSIKVHMKLVHQKEGQPRCNICNKVFTAKVSLERHMLLHTDAKPYSCEQCGESFRRLLNLRHHKSLVHDGINPHVCSECNETFKNYQKLYFHKQKVHNKRIPPSQQQQQHEACKLCRLRFPKGSLLMEHIGSKHAEEQYPILQCPHCPKTFVLSMRLASHKLIHSDRYICQLCGARHAEKKKLQYHMDLKHPSGHVYSCSECPRTFTSQHQLNLHIPVHTKGMQFHCDVCSKSFMRKCQLKIHARTHTGEKPLQCDGSLKRFKDDGSFSKHKQRCKTLANATADTEYLEDDSFILD